MSHCYHFYVLPPMASCCQKTFLLALHYWSCTSVFGWGPQEYPERSCTSTLWSTLQKITSGTSITCYMSHCYHFYVLQPMASCCQKTFLLALHYWSCTSVFGWGPQEYPERSCTSTLWSTLQKITSGTSITCYMSHCYHFYVLPPMASCCQKTFLLALHYW
nr:uncharacterized protein LOC129384917 [Dermacentor andersoni]